ncbi:hypothetical protein HY993_04750 [Candidatus Micrarchaeota archaeon]|nr:hypothetical protein [Candidatus Micrarchaeota archaeon]
MRNNEWMEKFPVIRLNEIARRTKSKAYAKLLVHRLVRAGKLTKAARGAYSAFEDVFSVASNLYFPSYVSGLSASYRNGLTEAIPISITVITGGKHKKIEYKKYVVEFIDSKQLWGYHKEGKDNGVVFAADLEKLLLDAFLHPRQFGNFEEIENAFKNSENIDVEKLKAYLLRLNSNKVYRQVGCLLERHQGTDLSGLMPVNKNYYRLNPFIGKGRKLNKKWRLFE